MQTYAVSYQRNETDDMEPLHAELDTFPESLHVFAGTWLVKTSDTVEEVRDELNDHLHPEDRLLVMKLSGEWATTWKDDDTDWMSKHLK